MGLFDLLHAYKNNASRSTIKRGFRGEGISYSCNGKSMEIDFTWINGDRLYTDSIGSWQSGEKLSIDEKQKVFIQVLFHLSHPDRRTIIVINPDDESADLWKKLSEENKDLIKSVEFWSHEDQIEFERQMNLELLKKQGFLHINGIEVKNQSEFDQLMEQINKDRNSR